MSAANTVLPTAQPDSTKPTIDTEDSYLSETLTNIINGKPVVSPSTYDVINPATGQVVARAPEATKEQLDEAVSAARAAFPAWKAKSWEERKEYLKKIIPILEDESFAGSLAKMLTIEMGKPIWLAKREVLASTKHINLYMTLSLDQTTDIMDDEDIKVYTRYVPLGVGAAILPWNFPVGMTFWKLVPALLTGNVLIVKPSPFTPLATLTLIAKLQEVFPPGVVSSISGGAEIGKLITGHPGIDKISFTGSIPTGKHVLRGAIDTLKRVTLELGGNDPCIVLPDADVTAVAQRLVMGSFNNSGQFCVATKRIYVHESIYDEFLQVFVERARQTKVGNPLDPTTMIGPVCNSTQYQIIRGFIDDCKANNHKFALGGELDLNSPGFFIPLSVVDNPPDDSRIVREEPFGPIVPILKWKDEAEVIRRANDTRTALGASVWGKDVEAMERIGNELEAGTVWYNSASLTSPLVPFGGHKESGLGVENGVEGLKAWCNIKTYSINKVPVTTQA